MDTVYKLKAKRDSQVEKEIEEEILAPYTMDEINSMIDESEADEKAGSTISGEEMSRRIEKYILSL